MKKPLALSLFALLFSIGVATSFAATADKTDCSKDTHYPLISKRELKKIAGTQEATIIDVNSKESFQKAHVPGAIHFESHEADMASVLPVNKNALIVAYCGGVQCEAWKKAAESACKMGYTNIRHFKEGISGWVKN